MTLTHNLRLDTSGLRIVEAPLRSVTPASFEGYGRIVTSFREEHVDIVPWPIRGTRRLDPGTGMGGGITSGKFSMQWKGDVLFAQNHAVGGSYVTGWSCPPDRASETTSTIPRKQVYTHEANYHPDGGQIFYPLNGAAFVALLALPGDAIRPEDFVAFYCPGDFGIHINPGVWHQPVYPLADQAEFDDKQGAVHACVSVNFIQEFGCLISVPLTLPRSHS